MTESVQERGKPTPFSTGLDIFAPPAIMTGKPEEGEVGPL